MRVGELIAKQAQEVGIKLTVQPLDIGTVRRIASARTFDTALSEVGPHGVADPDQFIMSHRSGYMWKAGRPYPEFDALFEEWKKTTDVESRKQVLVPDAGDAQPAADQRAGLLPGDHLRLPPGRLRPVGGEPRVRHRPQVVAAARRRSGRRRGDQSVARPFIPSPLSRTWEGERRTYRR